MDRPLSLLVVEDNPTDALFVEEALGEGSLVIENLVRVERLREAVRKLEADHFDVVLLDLGLPDSQGLDTLIELRRRAPAMPIVVMTGLGDERLGLDLVRKGAQDYLVKGQFTGSLLARSIRYSVEREKTEQALRFLTEASDVLASSLDYESTLRSLAELAVPRLADWCAVDVLESDRSVRRIAVVHRDPSKVALAHELTARYPPRLDGPEGAVLRTGQAVLMETVTEETLRQHTRDEAHLDVVRALGVRSAMAVPLAARGGILGVIRLVSAESGRRYGEQDLSFARDLARRAALAIDNARLYRDLQRAAASAEAANRMKDEFLATMSHELRTPLQAILGWATLLHRKQADPKTLGQGIDTIERNARVQAQIISDLLDVSRIVSGKLALEMKLVDLRGLLEAALDVVRPAAAAKGVMLEMVENPPVTPIVADADRLRQIAWNLLSNAVKFTPAGGRVETALRRSKAHVEIAVRDTGEGIPPEFLPFVFDRFRQADSSTTRRRGGLGLGLAIVRHLVELHGGTVRAESGGVGKGATFTVAIPIRELPEAQAAPAPPVSEKRARRRKRPNLSGARVLVVDDEPEARELISIALRDHGAEVRLAAGAAEAMEILAGWEPDVLVCDIAMPEEDGYSLIRKVRSSARGPLTRVPAIAFTAYAREEDRRLAIQAGFQVHLTKPIDTDDLVAAVARIAPGERSAPLSPPEPG
jgi:signal transduction histidine kinase/DNA-binding NarL/FixJ family response regulator